MVQGGSGRSSEREGARVLFEETTSDDFSELMKSAHPQTSEAQRTPRMKSKKGEGRSDSARPSRASPTGVGGP